MIVRLCAVAAVLLLSGTYQGSPPAEAPAQAVVRGIVSSESGARIGGADVHFTSEGRKVVTQTWSDGTYDAKLPPGIYNVIVTDGEGFCPGLRADFSARAGAEIHFDFMLKAGVNDWLQMERGMLIRSPVLSTVTSLRSCPHRLKADSSRWCSTESARWTLAPFGTQVSFSWISNTRSCTHTTF